MKSIRLNMTAAKIEFHWRRAARLEKRGPVILPFTEQAATDRAVSLRYHKYRAKALSYEYEILAGIRNSDGLFVA